MVASNNVSVGLQTVTEIRDKISLPVHGSLPSYLERSNLYRVAPGAYDVKHSDGEPYRIGHWFDGLSQLHTFYIDASTNSVSYRSHSLANGLMRAVKGTPSTRWSTFSFGTTDPYRSLLGRFSQIWTTSPIDPHTGRPHAPNIGVTLQPDIGGEKLVVCNDFSSGAALDEDTLQIDHFFKYESFDSSLKGSISAANGHVDPKTGEFFNFVYELNSVGATYYSIFKIRPDGSTQVLAKISEHPVYIHSFATTENYVVLILWPMYINPLKALWSRNIVDGCMFHESIDTKFIVISRHGDGVIATYSSPAFFCFHTVNAFELDDDIFIDLCRYKDGKILHEYKFPTMRTIDHFSPAVLTRFTLPSISGAATSSKVHTDEPRRAHMHWNDDNVLEFPRINPDFKQKNYTFVYGMSNEGQMFNAIAKVEVSTGRRVFWSKEDTVMGEPIFFPNPMGDGEDDGCLLVVVLDVKKNKSSLTILDAKSMTEIASAEVPQAVPFGFHGMICPAEAKKARFIKGYE